MKFNCIQSKDKLSSKTWTNLGINSRSQPKSLQFHSNKSTSTLCTNLYVSGHKSHYSLSNFSIPFAFSNTDWVQYTWYPRVLLHPFYTISSPFLPSDTWILKAPLFLINCLWGKKHCIHLLKAEKRQSVGSMAGSRPRDVMENIRTGADREGDQKAWIRIKTLQIVEFLQTLCELFVKERFPSSFSSWWVSFFSF